MIHEPAQDSLRAAGQELFFVLVLCQGQCGAESPAGRPAVLLPARPLLGAGRSLRRWRQLKRRRPPSSLASNSRLASAHKKRARSFQASRRFSAFPSRTEFKHHHLPKLPPPPGFWCVQTRTHTRARTNTTPPLARGSKRSGCCQKCERHCDNYPARNSRCGPKTQICRP